MKKLSFIYVSLLFMGTLQAEGTVLSKVEAYLSTIKKDIKQEWKAYEQEVVAMPQWEEDIQEREIATVD